MEQQSFFLIFLLIMLFILMILLLVLIGALLFAFVSHVRNAKQKRFLTYEQLREKMLDSEDL